mgnify:FL=1
MRNTKKLKAENKVGLIFFPAFDWEISPTHPERKERLLYTRDQVFEEGLLDIDGIYEYNPKIATDNEIKRANICVPSVDEVASKSHKISAGAAIKAANLVLEEEVDKAFAIVRPPGHHAHRIVHGARGFCNINNEAIMVESIRNKYPEKKIAFIDTDAHHADGTQEIFYHDPNVLHISLHQDGRTLFPGSGFINELGGPTAYAKTLNIPLPPGTTDEGLLTVLNKFVLPVLKDFNPDLVINSAGQDNHYSDPLTNMKISAKGYARMNDLLNPDLAILQGGYSIESALPYINVGLILAMAGLDYSFVEEPDYNKNFLKQESKITQEIRETIKKLNKIWEERNKTNLKNIYGDFSEFYSRNKNIFYDTAGINETQKEKIRICSDCQGYLVIDSEAGKSRYNSNNIKAISIPRLVCDNCYKEAKEKYKKFKKSNNFDQVFLQDLRKDEYLKK